MGEGQDGGRDDADGSHRLVPNSVLLQYFGTDDVHLTSSRLSRPKKEPTRRRCFLGCVCRKRVIDEGCNILS